jgi:hypothetical protein
MSLLLIAYKIAMVARVVVRSFKIVIQTLESGMANMLIFVLLIGLCMVGFSVIAMNVWGSSMMEFSDFPNAFLSVLCL